VRKELIVLLVLLGVFLAIGCTDNGSKATNKTGTPVSDNDTETITVSAAASLTEAFTDMEPLFEAKNPDVDVNFNFGGSGNLRTQIEGGAPVDVFASADENQMDILGNKSLIDNSSREDFVQNSLVLIVPENSKHNITDIKDLADPKVQKISIGNPDTAPVGKYTRTALNETGLWNQLENKMVPAEDVKQVLLYVERGEVDAGFVYMTDAKVAHPGTVKIVANVPVSTPVNYPISVVSSSEHKEEAQEFVDFVTGEEGQKTLQKYGFIVTSKQ
jgi:molybdate transport system substrate-binding protein